jgi:hypothetical protein
MHNRITACPHATPQIKIETQNAPCHTTGTERESARAIQRKHRNHTSLSAPLPSRPPTPPAPPCPPMVLLDAHRIRGTCRKSMVMASMLMASIMSCPPWAPCSSAPAAKRRVRRRLADLILAVVITVASAAAVGVVCVAVRRVPLLCSASQMLSGIVYHLRTPEDCRRECGKHETRRGAVALSSARMHLHTRRESTCTHTLAETDRAPVIVAGSLAVPGAV